MGVADQLNEDEELEWEGPEVYYDDEEYESYLTDKRLILYHESGFLSKTVRTESWDFEGMKRTNYESPSTIDRGPGGTPGPGETGMGDLTIDFENKQVKMECGPEGGADLLGKIKNEIEFRE